MYFCLTARWRLGNDHDPTALEGRKNSIARGAVKPRFVQAERSTQVAFVRSARANFGCSTLVRSIGVGVRVDFCEDCAESRADTSSGIVMPITYAGARPLGRRQQT